MRFKWILNKLIFEYTENIEIWNYDSIAHFVAFRCLFFLLVCPWLIIIFCPKNDDIKIDKMTVQDKNFANLAYAYITLLYMHEQLNQFELTRRKTIGIRCFCCYSHRTKICNVSLHLYAFLLTPFLSKLSRMQLHQVSSGISVRQSVKPATNNTHTHKKKRQNIKMVSI